MLSLKIYNLFNPKKLFYTTKEIFCTFNNINVTWVSSCLCERLF